MDPWSLYQGVKVADWMLTEYAKHRRLSKAEVAREFAGQTEEFAKAFVALFSDARDNRKAERRVVTVQRKMLNAHLAAEAQQGRGLLHAPTAVQGQMGVLQVVTDRSAPIRDEYRNR